MFDHKHYMPILRWRQGEWLALRDMHQTEKAWMTPLIELYPRDFNSTDVDEKLRDRIIGIKKNWGSNLFFLDPWLTQPHTRTSSDLTIIEAASNLARTNGLPLIPVTGLNRSL